MGEVDLLKVKSDMEKTVGVGEGHINFLSEKEKMEKAPRQADIDPHSQVKITEDFQPQKLAAVAFRSAEALNQKCGSEVTCDSMPEMPTVANQLRKKMNAGCDSRSVPLSSGHFQGFVEKGTCAPKGAQEVPMGWAMEPHGLVKIQSQQPEVISKQEENPMQGSAYRSLPTPGLAGAGEAGDGTAKIANAQAICAEIPKPSGDGGHRIKSNEAVKQKLADMQKRREATPPRAPSRPFDPSELDKILERLQKKNQEAQESLDKAPAGILSDHKTMERLQKLLERFLEKYLNDSEDGGEETVLQEANNQLWQAHFMLVDQIRQLRAENEELRAGK